MCGCNVGGVCVSGCPGKEMIFKGGRLQSDGGAGLGGPLRVDLYRRMYDVFIEIEAEGDIYRCIFDIHNNSKIETITHHRKQQK